jgi:DNA-binding response OmpR family regulator
MSRSSWKLSSENLFLIGQSRIPAHLVAAKVHQLHTQIEGYEVIGTGSPEESLNLAKTERFDLYLMDNWLSNTPGSKLTEQIREFDTKTPILFYSGAHTTPIKSPLATQGYLVKPVENEKLVAEVMRLIGESKLENPTRVVRSTDYVPHLSRPLGANLNLPFWPSKSRTA